MKYRKLPVVIEAVLWTGLNFDEILEFAGRTRNITADFCDTAWLAGAAPPCWSRLTIHTLEGDHIASIGDYIIKGVKGECYPCKPDIFEATYEVVDDERQDIEG